MDRHGGCSMAANATGVKRRVLAKKTLWFLALVSFYPFLYSYFLGFSSYNNIQFSTLIFSLFAHSMDRKFMFFICNGIVAFLVNNMNFSSSAGFINNAAEDGVDQTSEIPAATILVQENVASVEYDIISVVAGEQLTEEYCGYDQAVSKPAKDELEEEEEETEQCDYRAVSEPAEDELEEEEEEEEEEEVEENKGKEGTPTVEEVSDVSVSTEELNHKCEEFIRKMKEEIRIEAQHQQQLVTV